jgi:hypothetical protein
MSPAIGKNDIYIFGISLETSSRNLSFQQDVQQIFVKFLRSRINTEIEVDTPASLIIVGDPNLPFTKGSTVVTGSPILDTLGRGTKMCAPKLGWNGKEPNANTQDNSLEDVSTTLAIVRRLILAI